MVFLTNLDHLSERWETETDPRLFKLPAPFFYGVRGILFSQAASYADVFRIIDLKLRHDTTEVPHKNVLFEKDLNQTHPIYVLFNIPIMAKYLSMGFGNKAINKVCSVVIYYEKLKGSKRDSIFAFVRNHQKSAT